MTEDKQNWVLIYSSPVLVEVELIKGLLKENDIEAVLINKKDSAYLFGDIELYVTSEDAFNANQIISNTSLE
jgi:hypothetical protein